MSKAEQEITVYVGPDFDMVSKKKDPIYLQLYGDEIVQTLRVLVKNNKISDKDKYRLLVSGDEVELPFGIEYPFIAIGDEIIMLGRESLN